ncbi:hypothetical protein WM40_10415 [Robbsia andropogonis]|uniref:Uncharacterized protein n=1 Tax=Robbsia andropogonis TaxID=28092 RepID=A0A0F5K1H3_9BURK|nr:hypothetical protein WM40_10415 [Robbsia andropogonis]
MPAIAARDASDAVRDEVSFRWGKASPRHHTSTMKLGQYHALPVVQHFTFQRIMQVRMVRGGRWT